VGQAPEKCADDDLVTSIATVQQIVTGIRSAETENDMFAVIMIAVYGLVVRK